MKAWLLGEAEVPARQDDPERTSFAREMMTLRVRTIYATDSSPIRHAQDNRQRLFALSRAYADYLDDLSGDRRMRDFFGGMTTFEELAAQARELLNRDAEVDGGRLSPVDRELVSRVERTSLGIVREIFQVRLRAWMVSRQEGNAEEGVGIDPSIAADAAFTTDNVAICRDLHASGANWMMAAQTQPPEDEAGLEGVVQAAVRGVTLADLASGAMPVGSARASSEGEETVPMAPQIDREQLKTLFLANATWDNELFPDGQTVLMDLPTELLPVELQQTRRYPPIELSRVPQQSLLHACELGVDLVAIDSSISLSGDITTRISPYLPPELQPLYLDLHRAGMSNALSYWTAIIKAVQAFLNGLFDVAFSKDRTKT